MRNAGRRVDLAVLPGRGHGFSDRNDWTSVLGDVAQFLARAVTGEEVAA
jgi:dipeptidyl aminopeptidase/acylaminoacyl peptidase